MNPYKKLTLMTAMSIALSAANIANADITYNYSAVDRDISEFPPEDGGGPVWSWTNGAPTYTGNLPATWVAQIHNDGGVAYSQTVCGGSASGCAGFEIGMGARSYKDGDTNWGHSADFGLFHLAQDTNVTITVSADGSDLRSAFGLWSGWATGGSRHSAFLDNGALNSMADNPLGSGLTVVDANAWAVAPFQGTSTATLTRYLTAGDYTLILGGYDGSTSGANLAYSATITAAPVPLPGVFWLFSSALAGAGFLRGRKIIKTIR